METIFVARQPIYDRQLRVYAYELLFRNNKSNQAEITDGNRATSEVVVSAVMDIGLDNIVGQRPAFINMTRGFLTGELPLPMMKEQVILEVLEDVSPDDELITGLKSLAASGYSIALDDFVFRPEFKPLLEIAHIVKLDILALDRDQLGKNVELLRKFPIKLIAEKVETQEELTYCQELGFDYFQGYFFCKPTILSGKRPAGNRLVALELLAKLQDPLVEPEALEQLISQDATLAYRLLRYINSAFFGLQSTVESVRQTLTMMGPVTLRKWASLVLMVRLADGKPAELLVTGMIRAKMCEQVGSADLETPADRYFTVGLFSILDALMDMPLSEVLDSLPLPPETKGAILDYSGVLGDTLKNVLDYERGNASQLDAAAGAVYQDAYLKALQWCENSQQAVRS